MKTRLRDYWFLLASLAGLGLGLAFSAVGQAFAANVLWGLTGVIGLSLAVRWLADAIREGSMGSDALAVISIIATSITGEWLAAAVISLMLASGRSLENWAAGRANSRLSALLNRAPSMAHLVNADGSLTATPLDQIDVGSKILVRSGEVVPLDGTLLGHATFDESALTGEPLPVYRAALSEVASGVVNTDVSVELITTTSAESSTYAALVRLVAQAQAESASAVRIANKWAARFVPFALALAGITWVVSQNYSYAVAVIVSATPCPLILAVPVAIISGMSKAASKGAVIKGGAALESLAQSKVILLDKTGTLTHGGPEVSAIAVSPGTDESWLLQLAGSLEVQSPHVVAQAIVARAVLCGAELLRPTDVREVHGTGLSGHVAGHKVSVGQPVGELPAWANLSEPLLVAVQVDGEFVGLIGLEDPVREESQLTVSQLRQLGIERILLVSGDRHSTVESVAQAVGADGFHAECTAAQKLEIVASQKQRTNGKVVVVGDGINDAPALAAADVGVAMGARGATAASEAADVVILEDSIDRLAVAVDVAQGARSRALQASGVGMTLAIAAMLLGSFGVLNATEAALTQEFIDAGAILWALVPAKSRLGK